MQMKVTIHEKVPVMKVTTEVSLDQNDIEDAIREYVIKMCEGYNIVSDLKYSETGVFMNIEPIAKTSSFTVPMPEVHPPRNDDYK